MPLEDIRKSIDKDARDQAAKVRADGVSEAEAITSAAEARAAEILKAARAEAAKEADRIKTEQVSGTEIEMNSMLLVAMESVVDKEAVRVMKEVQKRLGSGKLAEKSLASALREFSKSAPKKDIIVKVAKRNAKLAKSLGYDAVPSNAEGEILLSTMDGSMSLDASPSTLVAAHDALARRMLHEKLFGKERKS
ncbi:MAG: V-type ATP synthase subunit E family protein [Candidatus Micrarchaeaceae archaeon]